MRKTSLLLAIIILVAGVSAQAQKKGIKPILPPTPPPGMLCVEDSDGGGFIVFDLKTGDFKCSMCEYNYAFGGTGSVTIDGFNAYLTVVTDEYQMFVSVNMWDRQGKALMVVLKAPDAKSDIDAFKEFWTDVNIDNNKMACASYTPR
jgi:hypothetical protein